MSPPMVVCLEPLACAPGVLAASLTPTADEGDRAAAPEATGGATLIRIPAAAHGCVAIIDVVARMLLATLAAHSDLVRSMCAMPDGSLATGGGKHDGTVRVWEPKQWTSGEAAPEAPSVDIGDGGSTAPTVLPTAAHTLSSPGFVFGMVVLPDAKPGSQLFALACARYNAIRICL